MSEPTKPPGADRVGPGARLGPYEVIAPLGSGGMGEVFLALDTRLERHVAVKVLPAELSADRERLARLEREARAASALNHPNIITVHDIGTSGSTCYIAMEFVEGKTLRELLLRGDLPVKKALEIAAQIADGLAKAHKAGIVHRDLKPENLMVSKDGFVKILDFGLAKFAPKESGALSRTPTVTSARTDAGTVLGTFAYMSPEQARGEAVDFRSDQFSFGTIAYEMVAGTRPFEGTAAADVMAAIIRDEPEPLSAAVPRLPAPASWIIERCLAKEPQERYASTQDLARDLATVRDRMSEVARPSTADSGAARADEGFWVAVLPFKHAGAVAELAALADGLSEEITTGLSRFSYLHVIARGSTAKYFGEAGDIRAIGRELGARYLMEGSIRQAGAKLRLAVQLVDAASGAQLWAENFERTFNPEAVFELQDDLAPRIVSTVADQYGALVHSMSESLRGRSAGEYSAHEAVLRAFGYWERVTREEHAEVRDILEAAVARAPGHGDCLAELSLMYWSEYVWGYNARPDPIGRARATAQRAVASAPTDHFAHYALAAALFFQKDFLAFRPAAERALALNRMDSSTAALLGTMIAYAGDWEYGVGVVERAMQLNPHHPGWYHYAVVYDAYRRRDYRGALASALKVNMPGYYWWHATLAAVYGQLGEPERARAALRDLQALLPNFGAMARDQYGKWHDAELVEHLLDGLRKAGLEIACEE